MSQTLLYRTGFCSGGNHPRCPEVIRQGDKSWTCGCNCHDEDSRDLGDVLGERDALVEEKIRRQTAHDKDMKWLDQRVGELDALIERKTHG